ncbi:uncharacterized protein [Embiotoca jacksoni]|uniref:uncharacterized protein isoform X1 n=1 Tax=Embiotoca jacksoni TaxID=100190 RepID=UPI0037046D06
MTPWRYIPHLTLVVFLTMIDLSKEDSLDYFQNPSNWGVTEEYMFPLINTTHPKDVMECSVENLCKKNKTFCHILSHSFNSDPENPSISEKCKGESYDKIHFNHFFCLTAIVLNYTSVVPLKLGCNEYDTVFRIFSEIPSDSSDHSTKPPTTLPETTTAALPLTTTTTTTTTTLQQTTMTTATTKSKPNTGGTNSGQHSENKTITAEKSLLAVSVILNVVLSLVVYRYMNRERRRDREQSYPKCHLINTNSAPTNINDCSVGNEALLLPPLTHSSCITAVE